tara:strand:+ start:144 stop:1088 length:945 start_codon:yes stop_codon:yes gene_type:complete
MNKSIKRICNIDIKRYNNEKKLLNDMGIFVHFNEDDIMKCKAMIIGPEDTPYGYGMLFFDITFTSNYPFNPPKVKYISNSITRIHPNLYVNGKVCLSILGTWSGPGWVPTMNIISLLTTIQSLLTSNPIEHEPHFEKETGPRSIQYIKIINYERFRSLIIDRYDNLRPDLQYFKNDIIKSLQKNNTKILELLDKQSVVNEGTIYSNIYSIHINTDWKSINDKIKNILHKNDLIVIDEDVEEEPHTNTNNEITDKVDIIIKTPIKKKKYPRKCPNILSKNYPIGTIKISENDNKQYIVKEYIVNTKQIKKWVKFE